METKIKNFLQSEAFILSLSLLLGFLCHFFVVTEIIASDKKIKDTKSFYASAFDFRPSIGKKLQSTEHEDYRSFRLSTLLETHRDDGLKMSTHVP